MLAEAWVATHHRPALLREALGCLRAQVVPAGWEWRIRVIGAADDPGRDVAEAFGAVYQVCAARTVGAKLNAALAASTADLALLADDDDLQGPTRLTAAVKACEAGADWAAVGSVLFCQLRHGYVSAWEGNASRGLVGTSVSIRPVLARAVGGWPTSDRGKDGPVRRSFDQVGARFADLTGRVEIVCLQHDDNLWPRPFLQPGVRRQVGSFVVTGREGVEALPAWAAPAVARLRPTDRYAPGLISVLMAARGTAAYVNDAVASVLAQELPAGWRLELLVGVDEDSEVAAVLRGIQDPRLGVVDCERGGTYKVANALLQRARGAIVTRADSDDLMLSGRLAALVGALADPAVDMAGTWYAEVTADLHPLRSRRVAPDGIWAFRRPVFDAYLGGWEAWSCAADAELVQRARALGLRAAVVENPLYLHRQHDDQLTRAGDTGFGSTVRRSYVAQIRARGDAYASGARPERVKPVPASVRGESGGLWDRTVTASLASVPWRAGLLERVVAALLPQVDLLNVYLNGYDHIPAFLEHERIEVATSQDHGDRGDAGKMFWAQGAVGYQLTCDDDIDYPADYVARLVEGIERHERRAVVSFHGSEFLDPFESFVRSRRSLRFGAALERDTPVHCLGTGVLGYHASLVQVRRTWFEAPNMADVWLGRELQRLHVPSVVLAHSAGWLRDLGSYERSIYCHSHACTGSDLDTGGLQTRIVRESWPWRIYSTSALTPAPPRSLEVQHESPRPADRRPRGGAVVELDARPSRHATRRAVRLG